MSEGSAIAWCDHTFNPWHGCVKVSPGCQHCYAETWRFKKADWGPTAKRVRTGESYWKQPLKWNKETWFECSICGWRGPEKDAGMHFHSDPAFMVQTRQRVFCASMADVFEDNAQVANWRGELFQLIQQTPNLDWLLLTKRPELIFRLGTDAVGTIFDLWLEDYQNVWLGTSVENQAYFDERVGALVKNGLHAAVRFLSVEPMIGSVRLVPTPVFSAGMWEFVPGKKSHIDWVICGGESGKECRPAAGLPLEWARDLRDDCKRWGVKFFMKQLGGFPDKREKLLDLPEDLRVREMPVGRVQKILHLHLKGEYFDAIKSGEKTEEFREVSETWYRFWQ